MVESNSGHSAIAARPVVPQSDPKVDNRPLVVNVLPYEANGWRWFESATVDQIRWEFFFLTMTTWLHQRIGSSLALTRVCAQAIWFAQRKRAKLLITHDPKATLRCGIVNRLARRRIPHLAWGFNFAALPRGIKKRLMTAAFRDVDRFIVFSTMERDLYAAYFQIPVEKFTMVHWAMSPMKVTSPDLPLVAGEYICSLGGNARDYPTLMAAMATLPDIPLVAVLRPENLQGLTVPPNVTIRTNIPFPEAANILSFSRFTVVPLVGSEVPCGHITMVVATQLGVAAIVTRSTGLDDYAIPDQTALTYRDHDPVDLASQIRRLWDDRALNQTLSANSRQFFQEHCTEDVMRDALADQLTHYGLLAQSPA